MTYGTHLRAGTSLRIFLPNRQPLTTDAPAPGLSRRAAMRRDAPRTANVNHGLRVV